MNLVEEYLLNEKPFEMSFDPTKPNTAVIIEPRPLPILPYIIWNVMRNIGKDWNLVIIGSSGNFSFLKNTIKGTYLLLNPEIENFNQKTYSLLLTSLSFWEIIPGENILIFQWDSFMLKPFDETIFKMFEQYPFIGSVYQFLHPLMNIDTTCPVGYNFNINGGFSFRKKSVMIECIKKISTVDIIRYRNKNKKENVYFHQSIIWNEDVFFVNALVMLGYPLPSIVECSAFCTQVDPNLETTCAIHNYQYPYLPVDFLQEMLNKHPNKI